LPNSAIAPLAAMFVASSASSLPPNLLPSQYKAPPSPLSYGTSPRKSASISPSGAPPANYEDILIFDLSNGMLSLRRLTLSTRSSESGSMASYIPYIPLSVGSSLGVGFAGPARASKRRSISPTSVRRSSASGLSQMIEKRVELVAKESAVATWDLVRKADWKEVKEVVKGVMVGLMAPVIKCARSKWLSLAELVTSSQLRHVLPGSIYLSHQFYFFALCEDYHALIRQKASEPLLNAISGHHVREQLYGTCRSMGASLSFPRPHEI